jgi:putative heme iron utilization protein
VNIEQLLKDCRELQDSFDCLLLSSVNSCGEPLSSFAPYIEHETNFYIFVSELAEHTGNMLETAKASVMFIEGEQSANNLYARKRAIIQVSVTQVEENSGLMDKIISKMLARHGKTITLLRSLADFRMLELKPNKGRYIVGFGKAYDWDVQAGTLTHISEKKVKQDR